MAPPGSLVIAAAGGLAHCEHAQNQATTTYASLQCTRTHNALPSTNHTPQPCCIRSVNCSQLMPSGVCQLKCVVIASAAWACCLRVGGARNGSLLTCTSLLSTSCALVVPAGWLSRAPPPHTNTLNQNTHSCTAVRHQKSIQQANTRHTVKESTPGTRTLGHNMS